MPIRPLILLPCVASFLWLDASSLSNQPTTPSFSVLDLGTLGGKSSAAYAINDKEQVTGAADTAEHFSNVFLYSDNQMHDVSDKNDNFGSARGINVHGHLAGVYRTSKSKTAHAGLLREKNVNDLGTLGGATSFGYGVNDHDEVVGWAYTKEEKPHAFLYAKGVMNDLGTLPGGSESDARAINNSGQLVGNAKTLMGDSHAFFYSDGEMQDLNTFNGNQPGVESEAFGLNDKAEVVGWSYIGRRGSNGTHAFLYTNHKMLDLGTLCKDGKISLRCGSAAFSINNRSEVVGQADSDVALKETHAFLYRDSTMFDLNALIPTNLEWKLVCATSINNRGYIVGYGVHKGAEHAFLLRPNPKQSIERNN